MAKAATKRGAKKPAKKATPRKARKVSPVPKGYGTVTAEMNQDDAAGVIKFCRSAFGAKLRGKMAGPGGKIMHAEVEIGDSVVMVGDAMQEPARVSSLFLYVPDVDKTFAKAVKAGATVRMPPTDMFWGDRFARVTDPFGNLWGIATHIEDVSESETKKRMKAMFKQNAAEERTGQAGS